MDLGNILRLATELHDFSTVMLYLFFFHCRAFSIVRGKYCCVGIVLFHIQNHQNVSIPLLHSAADVLIADYFSRS